MNDEYFCKGRREGGRDEVTREREGGVENKSSEGTEHGNERKAKGCKNDRKRGRRKRRTENKHIHGKK